MNTKSLLYGINEALTDKNSSTNSRIVSLLITLEVQLHLILKSKQEEGPTETIIANTIMNLEKLRGDFNEQISKG